MSKIVLAGIVGSLTVVTGLLFYSANLRDSKSSDEDDSDTESESETETEPKTKIRTRINEKGGKEKEKEKEKEELDVIEDKPISKKRERHATTSKKVPRSKSNTRRNRNR